MYFAQFYNRKLDGTLGEAVGDRGVFILDGRNNKAPMGQDAVAHAQRYGFEAYSIHAGESFTRSRKVSGPWPVPGKQDSTAASASYGA